jgi:glycosyltransferase involved in cell wall biosynthesis
MNISILVRTRNEHRNIERFCRGYEWADNILVADGGSTDDTIELASKFPNVKVRNYPVRVYGDNNLWRNPEGRHINFLIEWGRDLGSDWMVLDDCDSFPTNDLRTAGRSVFEQADASGMYGILAFHLYLYGSDQWFLNSIRPDGRFIWAWRTHTNLHAQPQHDWGIVLNNVPKNNLELDPPKCLLHDFCPTPEITQEKVDFYNNSGKMPLITSITGIFGALAPREEWMKE